MKSIFVFGSNLAGRHGAGAARVAREQYGALVGIGVGPMAMCYAVPTKDWNIKTLSFDKVKVYVGQFIDYTYSAKSRDRKLVEGSQRMFKVTRIGCGLAGFEDSLIAPLFNVHPKNCYFDYKWKKYLPDTAKFWGTY